MSKPPYPGFPSYPPGDPRNVKWEDAVRAYNAEIQLANKRLELRIAISVIIILLLIGAFHMRAAICSSLL